MHAVILAEPARLRLPPVAKGADFGWCEELIVRIKCQRINERLVHLRVIGLRGPMILRESGGRHY